MTAEQNPSEQPAGWNRRRFHVLTLTPFYPTLVDDAEGCFVSEPLSSTSELGIFNTVMAVRPFYRPYAIANPHAFPAQQVRFLSLTGGWGLPTSGAGLYASLLGTVRRLHRLNPVDVIHVHAALPCGHAAALLGRELKIPFVVTVHGLDAYWTSQVPGPAGTWCRRASRFVYMSAARVLCISEKVQERVLQGTRDQVKTEVIYNGVDPEKFYPSNDSAEQTILCVGNLIPTKGQDVLLRALAAVLPKFPEFSCDLIGDGPQRSHLSKIVSELQLDSKVRFLGRCSRKEVAAAMRRCALFALPSGYEGLGCVYLEAMSTGKPAIGCRGQGIDEVIEHGANGWLVSPDSVEDMTQALCDLLGGPQLRKELGQQARLTILRNFTLADQAEGLARIYQECAR